MRELTLDEMEKVAGGDGFVLGGSRYISGTRLITGGLGVIGAADVGYHAGYAIGTGLNVGSEMVFGTSASDFMGGVAYNALNS